MYDPKRIANDRLRDEFLKDMTGNQIAQFAAIAGGVAALIYGIVIGLLGLIGAPTWTKNLVAFGLIGIAGVTVLDERNRDWRVALKESGRAHSYEWEEKPVYDSQS